MLISWSRLLILLPDKRPNIEKLFGWKPEKAVVASTYENVHQPFSMADMPMKVREILDKSIK